MYFWVYYTCVSSGNGYIMKFERLNGIMSKIWMKLLIKWWKIIINKQKIDYQKLKEWPFMATFGQNKEKIRKISFLSFLSIFLHLKSDEPIHNCIIVGHR